MRVGHVAFEVTIQMISSPSVRADYNTYCCLSLHLFHSLPLLRGRCTSVYRSGREGNRNVRHTGFEEAVMFTLTVRELNGDIASIISERCYSRGIAYTRIL